MASNASTNETQFQPETQCTCAIPVAGSLFRTKFWCNYLYNTIYIIFVIYSYYIDFVFEIVWALLLSANPVNPLLEILAPSAGSNVVKRRQDVDGFTVPLPLMRSQRKNAEDV